MIYLCIKIENSMSLTLIDLGKKVKLARKNYTENGVKTKLTQIELAKRSGLSLRGIQNIEQGKNAASIRSLIAISIVLKKRLVIFFDDI